MVPNLPWTCARRCWAAVVVIYSYFGADLLGRVIRFLVSWMKYSTSI